MNNDEAVLEQKLDYFLRRPLAAEEERPFVLLEWSQARIGHIRQLGGENIGWRGKGIGANHDT